MKKVVAVTIVAVLVSVSVAGWYFLEGQPATQPAQKVTATKQAVRLNPDEHGFFDVDFAQKMIVHHQQAIEMADIILASSGEQNVRNVETDMREKQSDFAEQYKTWLSEWGESYTNLADFPQMDGHDMYPSYPGLVSAADMMSLRSASPSEADKLYTDLMIEHHNGGIQTGEMSKKLQYGKMIDFKDKVFKGYSDELERIKEL